ncbi:MAG: ATP-dependent DNA helicase [Nanoarchaeota archaeon]
MVSNEDILFPHSKIRNVQGDLIKEVISALENKKHLIAHAPTGLGKTAATIPACLSFALKNELTVFFLTSRHTQHKLAVDTIKLIKKKYQASIICSDIIGKKFMCAQEAVEILYSNEFADYCKKLREDNKCEFYANTKKKSGSLTVLAKSILEELKILSPSHTKDLIDICKSEKLCPYEMTAILAKEAKIIISDYNYIFNPSIRDNFFLKTGKELEKCIIIVDEAHNLPKRVRELLSSRLTNFILRRAIKEAEKFGFFDERDKLQYILDIISELSIDLGPRNEEKLIKKQDFVNRINLEDDYDSLITMFTFTGDQIKEKQKQSYISSVALFLETWLGTDQGFARIITKRPGTREHIMELSYRCLDPSIMTKEVIEKAYSVILMSGTLTPTFMYKDILGFSDVTKKEFTNPFPEKNKLSLIIPETTTKFTRRNKEEYKKIADKIDTIVNHVPGNVIVFFPSYDLRNNVYVFLDQNKKRFLLEKSSLSKEEKSDLLEEFKSHKSNGAVLLAATTGNFGEGIDLPGDFLKAVIIVGLPLEKPTLEIKELINYYDRLYKKGWEYGYTYPAIIKVLQNAGRCIRSETDKGLIVFLDERFAWERYYQCFPLDYDIKISKLYEKKISEFFS